MAKKKKKKKTMQQMLDYINDQSLRIKRVSRDFFMGTDIGTRRHKVKKKYTRKPKYKKNWDDEIRPTGSDTAAEPSPERKGGPAGQHMALRAPA